MIRDRNFKQFSKKNIQLVALLISALMILLIFIAVIALSKNSIDPRSALEKYIKAYQEKDLPSLAASIYAPETDEYQFLLSQTDYFTDPPAAFDNLISYKAVNLSKNGDYAECDLHAKFKRENGTVTTKSHVYFFKREGIWRLSSDFSGLYTAYILPKGENNQYPVDNINSRNPLRISDTSITSYKIKDGEYVDSMTFNQCTKLKKITFPASYVRIEGSWFSECKNLTAIYVDKDNPYFISVDGVLYTKGLITLIAFPAGKSVGEGETEGVFILPETVVNASNYAFCNSKKLNEVVFPDRFIAVPDFAFVQSSIKKVTLSKNTLHIGSFAFSECAGLTEIALPQSVRMIGHCAFSNCTNLYQISFAENASLKTIGYSAFDGCKMLQISDLPDTVETIGNWAFQDTRVYFTALPAHLKYIGMYAFRRCYMLKDVFVPGNIEYIGRGAFMADFQLELRFAAPSPNEKWDAMWDAGIHNEPVWSAEATN